MTGITDYNLYHHRSLSPGGGAYSIRNLTYLSIGDSSISVLVDLFNQLGNFLLTHIETSGFYESLDLVLTNGTIIVQVNTHEGFVDVEAGSLVESLSQLLREDFNLEVGSPDILELNLGVN
jgi:hypothetical protein